MLPHEIYKKLDQKNVWLITGVAGFIGSNLLERLLSLNQIVRGVDNLSTGFLQNLDNVRDLVEKKQWQNFTFIKGDIRDYGCCVEAIKGSDYVLHQAALGSVPRSIENPKETNDVNVSGFLNVLLASKNCNVKRLIYASSSSVYGDNSDLKKIEDKVGKLISPYAITKYINELYAKNFFEIYKVQTVGLRYFNVFGPRQNALSDYSAVIPLWIKKFLDNEDVFINGDGSISRDFTYISNIVNANILASLGESKNVIGEVFNIGAGGSITLNDLFITISSEFDSNKEPINRSGRPGDILHSCADISKAIHALGYSVETNFYSGIKKTIRWYKNKPI